MLWPFWFILVLFWIILGTLWPMLGSFGVPNWSLNRAWGIWWAPWIPQRAPWEPKRAILLDFWFFWDHSWRQNQPKIDANNLGFFEHGCCLILVCFGLHVCIKFRCFSELATTDLEKARYVMFINRIEEFVDSQKTQGQQFLKQTKLTCLGILTLVCLASCRTSFLKLLGSFWESCLA